MASRIPFHRDVILTYDPTNVIYRTTCYVCKEQAKPGTQHLKNYGAITCYSCRAFWRRCHSKSRHPVFTCNKSTRCEVTVATRRRCQKCRYDRCLRAGMNPEFVLSEEQKQVRFRKRNQKRRRQQRLQQNESDHLVPDVLQELGDEDVATVNEMESDNTASETPEQSTWTILGATTYPENLVREDSTKSLFDESNTYDILKRLIDFRNGHEYVTFSKTEVFSLMSLISKEFKCFALQQWQFTQLSQKEQKRMLSRNTPLYLQLHMGFFLFAQDDSNIGDEGCFKKAWMKNFTQNLHLERFNSKTNLFIDSADLDYYGRLIIQLKGLHLLNNPEMKVMLAFIILFTTDESYNMSDEVETLRYSMYNNWIRTSFDILSLESFTKTLLHMALFCSYAIDWNGCGKESANSDDDDDDSKLLIKSSVQIHYTFTEESWLNHQVSLVNDAIRSVTVGEELMLEFFLHAKGQTLSKTHMPNFFKITVERMIRILKTLPDFEDLPHFSQTFILAQNIPQALALFITKAESCETALEQLQEGFGVVDEIKWNQDYLPQFENPDEMKRNTLGDANILCKSQLTEFLNLVSNSSILVSDPLLYKLNMLITLTKPLTNQVGHRDLSALHQKYSMLMMRRLKWTQKNHQNISQILKQTYSGFQNLDRISQILTNVMSKG